MIRKSKFPQQPSRAQEPGFDLESIATFEVSSEADDHPLENILLADTKTWKASESGTQNIRINFDAPQDLARIFVRFDETRESRTQEFVLSCQSADDAVWTEVRRQQFNFSPPGTTTEIEEFVVALPRTNGLEITITPSIGGHGIASLTHLVVA